MNKILEKALAEYKKASKPARLKILARYDCKTEAEFLRLCNGIDDEAATVETTAPVAPTDMVIAFDTTGSMAAYISSVRTHVKETVENLFQYVPDLRIKIVAFGDYCDMRSATDFGKAYQQTELTNDKAALIQFIKTAQSTGGGDSDEFYELVLKKILEETPWREGSNRNILLIADCDPHPVGYTLKPFVTKNQIDWRNEARKAAELHVRVDTMRIIPGTRWYAELSELTEGTCMDFSNAGRTQEVVEAAAMFSSRSLKSMTEVKNRYVQAVKDGDEEILGVFKGMASTYSIDLDK